MISNLIDNTNEILSYKYTLYDNSQKINLFIYQMKTQKSQKNTISFSQKQQKMATIKHSESTIMKSKNHSPIKNIQTSYAGNNRTKTAPVQQIQQIAERHYQKAMKYVYKKNQNEQDLKKKQQAKNNPRIQQLTEQHTFHPILRSNKYNKKIQQRKKDNKKENQLQKWGLNHTILRRQKIIRQETKTLRYSVEKQMRSLENSRISSIAKSIGQNSVTVGTIGTSKQKSVNNIPGVKKFYLNQVKAQVARDKHEKLLFKGDQSRGYQY